MRITTFGGRQCCSAALLKTGSRPGLRLDHLYDRKAQRVPRGDGLRSGFSREGGLQSGDGVVGDQHVKAVDTHGPPVSVSQTDPVRHRRVAPRAALGHRATGTILLALLSPRRRVVGSFWFPGHGSPHYGATFLVRCERLGSSGVRSFTRDHDGGGRSRTVLSKPLISRGSDARVLRASAASR